MVSPRGGSLGITQSLTAAVNNFIALKGLKESEAKRKDIEARTKMLSSLLKARDVGDKLEETFKDVPVIDQQTKTPSQTVTGGTSGQAVGPQVLLDVGPQATRSGSTPGQAQQLGLDLTGEQQNVLSGLQKLAPGSGIDLSMGSDIQAEVDPSTLLKAGGGIKLTTGSQRKKISDEAILREQDIELGLLKQQDLREKLNPELREKRLEKDALRKAQTENLKKSASADTNFKRVVSAFEGIISQVRGAQEEQGGLGIIPGIKGKVGSVIPGQRGKFSRTQSAFGQKVETALQFNSILTGQNRLIVGVFDKVLESLPGSFDPETTVAAKTAQSLTNLFKANKVIKDAGLTTEDINKLKTSQTANLFGKEIEFVDIDMPPLDSIILNEAEEKELEAIIQRVLASPAAPVRKLGLGKQKEQKKLEDLSKEDIAGLSDEELEALL